MLTERRLDLMNGLPDERRRRVMDPMNAPPIKNIVRDLRAEGQTVGHGGGALRPGGVRRRWHDRRVRQAQEASLEDVFIDVTGRSLT
jgi:hypothetical protein